MRRDDRQTLSHWKKSLHERPPRAGKKKKKHSSGDATGKTCFKLTEGPVPPTGTSPMEGSAGYESEASRFCSFAPGRDEKRRFCGVHSTGKGQRPSRDGGPG